MRRLEINGGQVLVEPGFSGETLRLHLPAIATGYADAQIDDYATLRRAQYPWRRGVVLSLRARFSQGNGRLLGTAGFGLWNAPFGDPTVPWPALPQAVWFFYASAPGDLPLASDGAGQGWFASTLDATTCRALRWSPLTPLVLGLNRWKGFRQRVWPAVQRDLGISFAPISTEMTAWHSYELRWEEEGCAFAVDGRPLLQTPHTPRGPLGFVAWIDNQYMIAKANGRFAWGTLPTTEPQWLEIADLRLEKI